MHHPKDTEEPAGAENPPVAPAPPAPGFWRRIDWPNVSAIIGIVIALLTMFGYGLWRAIDDVDRDVGKLSERMDGELRDIRSDIGAVRGDVKTVSGDVQYIKGQLDSARNESASHADTPVAAPQRVSSHAAKGE